MRHRLYVSLAALLLILGTALAQDVTLRALMEDVPETHIIAELLPEFEEATGIQVEFEIVQYGAMHDKLVTQMLSPTNTYDFLQVDFLWAGEFPAAGWLEPLEPYVEESGFDLGPYLPSMLDLVGYYEDTLYMIPMYNYAMGVIYRTDVLEDPDLAAAHEADLGRPLELPATVEDYVETSVWLTENADMAGAVMQGQRGDPNFLEFANYLFGLGGDFVGDDWNVTLDSEVGREAMALYARNIQEAAPTGSLNYNLDDTYRVMCQGGAWSFVSYWWMLPQVDNAEDCPEAAGHLALAPMPGGNGVAGGWGWGIPHNSPHKDAAWRFIEWAESEDIVLRRALAGHAPTRSDAFTNAEVLEAYPYYADVADIVENAMSVPLFEYTAQMEEDVGREISLASAGEKSAEEATEDAAEALLQLLERAGLQ
jgi:ABC-type glycerol-3-phosphate transport system substrate-binding protein